MFYQFELMMAGVILLSAMAVGGITLWLKRRKTLQNETELHDDNETHTS